MTTIRARAEKTAIDLFFSETEGIEKIEDLTEDTLAWHPFEDWEFSDLITQVEDTADALEAEFYKALNDSESYEHTVEGIVLVAFGADSYESTEDIDELVQNYADTWSMDMNDVAQMVKTATRSARRPA